MPPLPASAFQLASHAANVGGVGRAFLCVPLEMSSEEQCELSFHVRKLREAVARLDRGAACDRGTDIAEVRQVISQAGQALRAAAAPAMYAELEVLASRHFAPFYLLPGDAAAAYHATDLAKELASFLAPEPSGSGDEIAGQAETLQRRIEEALGGKLTFEFHGAQVPGSEAAVKTEGTIQEYEILFREVEGRR